MMLPAHARKLDQDRNWVGLGVRSDRLHDLAS